MKNRTIITGIVRNISGAMMIIAGAMPVYSQNQTEDQTIVFKQAAVIQNRQDAVINMATSQYWDADSTGISKGPKPDKKGSATINTPAAYNISGEDKYIKTPEAGKRYEEFQVFDISGMDHNDVAVGLLTNTLDRATRYDEKGDLDTKVHVATGYLGELSDGGKSLSVNGADAKTPVSAIRFRDKFFLLIGNNDYRYVDGKKLVGDQKVVDALVKGKPITEVTFFYELQKAGLISKNMTVTQFTKMSPSQKQRILNSGVMAGNL